MKRILALFAAVSAISLTPAAHAAVTLAPGSGAGISGGTGDTTVDARIAPLPNGSPDGSFTITFDDAFAGAGSFTELLTFMTTVGGFLNAGVQSTTALAGGFNDTDLTSITLTGTGLATQTLQPLAGSNDVNEDRRLVSPILVGPGTYQLSINGTPGTGTGGFSGQVSLTAATPVPEPATWGMMLIGFGFLGAALRRKKGSAYRGLVRFA